MVKDNLKTHVLESISHLFFFFHSTGVPIIDENVYNLNYSCRDRPFYNISLNSASPVILPPYPFITTTPVIGLSISQQGGSLKVLFYLGFFTNNFNTFFFLLM